MLVRETVYPIIGHFNKATVKGRARELPTVFQTLARRFKNIPGTDSFYVDDIEEMVKVLRRHDDKWAGRHAVPYVTPGFVPYFKKKSYIEEDGKKLWTNNPYKLSPEGFDQYHISVHMVLDKEDDFIGWICN
jgi:hypothetical protein